MSGSLVKLCEQIMGGECRFNLTRALFRSSSLIVKSNTCPIGRSVRLSALFGFGKVEVCGPLIADFSI